MKNYNELLLTIVAQVTINRGLAVYEQWVYAV